MTRLPQPQLTLIRGGGRVTHFYSVKCDGRHIGMFGLEVGRFTNF